MEWQYERRLKFVKSAKWQGWFCERCCWNIPGAPRAGEEAAAAKAARDGFEDHDCEAFAAANWPRAAGRN